MSDQNPERPVRNFEHPCSELEEALQIPPTKSGRPRTQIDNATAWLRKTLSDGPKSVIAIRKGATARGDSWSTVRRARKELQVITVFAGDKHLWALPGQVGEIGRANVRVDVESDLAAEVAINFKEKLVSALHQRASICKTDRKSITDIEQALRQIAKDQETPLPKDEVEALITAIATQYATIPVWNTPDPAQAIAQLKDIGGLIGEIRTAMSKAESDPELMKRLDTALKLVRAEQKRR